MQTLNFKENNAFDDIIQAGLLAVGASIVYIFSLPNGDAVNLYRYEDSMTIEEIKGDNTNWIILNLTDKNAVKDFMEKVEADELYPPLAKKKVTDTIFKWQRDFNSPF